MGGAHTQYTIQEPTRESQFTFQNPHISTFGQRVWSLYHFFIAASQFDQTSKLPRIASQNKLPPACVEKTIQKPLASCWTTWKFRHFLTLKRGDPSVTLPYLRPVLREEIKSMSPQWAYPSTKHIIPPSDISSEKSSSPRPAFFLLGDIVSSQLVLVLSTQLKHMLVKFRSLPQGSGWK